MLSWERCPVCFSFECPGCDEEIVEKEEEYQEEPCEKYPEDYPKNLTPVLEEVGRKYEKGR